MSSPKSVEFNAVDGTVLRGNVFMPATASAKVPIIVMTQGLTLLKEHYIPDFARRFAKAGYAVLIYDHRGWGSSGGEVRNVTDPMQQAEDYHDAVIFARSLSGVDAERVAIWGIGHSGGASMIAAGDDEYIKAVILLMPFISGKLDIAGFPPGMSENIKTDRLAKVLNPGMEMTYVQVWDDSSDQASSERGQIILHGPAPYNFIHNAEELSKAAGTPWENRISLQSLYSIGKVEPKDHIYKISPRPMLYLAATTDVLTGPLEEHKRVFELAGEPKEFVTLHDHHIANYFNDSFERNITAQIDFLIKYL